VITACRDADDARAGGIGLPVPSVTPKLVPSDGQLEVRVQSPCATPGFAPFRDASRVDRRPLHVRRNARRMMPLCHVVVARLYQSEVVGLDFAGKRVLPETTQPRSAVSPTAVRRHGANYHRIRELPVTVPAREAPPPSQHTREPEVNDSRHRTSW
jgi:hypothetical protein